ncbi:MAG: EipA family protein [Steroidobacterales bacterium]
MQKEKTILAPVRFGVGWRQGASVGYMHFSRKKRYNPF